MVSVVHAGKILGFLFAGDAAISPGMEGYPAPVLDRWRSNHATDFLSVKPALHCLL
jgi:hypothetical protein